MGTVPSQSHQSGSEFLLGLKESPLLGSPPPAYPTLAPVSGDPKDHTVGPHIALSHTVGHRTAAREAGAVCVLCPALPRMSFASFQKLEPLSWAGAGLCLLPLLSSAAVGATLRVVLLPPHPLQHLKGHGKHLCVAQPRAQSSWPLPSVPIWSFCPPCLAVGRL